MSVLQTKDGTVELSYATMLSPSGSSRSTYIIAAVLFFASGTALPWVANAGAAGRLVEAVSTGHAAEAAPSEKPTVKRRAKHHRRSTGHITLPRANPTAPGLDRCGISAVAVCPER